MALLALVCAASLGAQECCPSGSIIQCLPESGGGVPPSVSLTINAVPGSLNDLLVVPPSGWVVNLAITKGSQAIDPARVGVGLTRWGGGSTQVLPMSVASGASKAVAVVPFALDDGTYDVEAIVGDVGGRFGHAVLAVAVREFANGVPPIASGQQIWLDFASDRDAVPGPDFRADLQAFGLGSAGAPALSQEVETRVIDAVLDRVSELYHDSNPNELPGPDPVNVDFTSVDPGAGDVTRICVGGADPTGSGVIGNVLTDPNNSLKASIECATLPPTGIFPRSLLWFQSDATFQSIYSPLRASKGGTPVGAHPLDASVLAPDFDPAAATPEQIARHDQIALAIQVFGDVLGTIAAHESGHALGIVPAGPPGGGLFGGSIGALSTHNVDPSGQSPAQNYVMNAGNTYTFSKLAGLDGQPLAVFRALNHAYLRDRVVIDPRVTALLAPPELTLVTPPALLSSLQTLTLTGSGFVATPSVRLVGPYAIDAIGEAFVSGQQMTAVILRSQVPAGTYGVELTNPDGQTSEIPALISVP